MKNLFFTLVVAAITLISAASFSAASELAIAVVYVCEAQEVHEATVKECATQYPSLASRASASWENWLSRNKEDLKMAKQQCSKEIQKQYTTQQQRDEVLDKLMKLKLELLRSFPQMIQSQGEVFCHHYLSALDSGENDLNHLFKPENSTHK